MKITRIAIFHAAIVIVYLITIYWHFLIPRNPLKTPGAHYGGLFKFLTFWNLLLQCFVFGLCLTLDFLPFHSRFYHTLTKLRDFTFTSLALPLGMFVVFVFWSLWCIDPELVMPSSMTPFYPKSLSHLSHTFCAPVLMLQMYTFNHPHPARRTGVTAILSVAAVYVAWIFYIGIYKGFWVYPVLKILDWQRRSAFIAVCLGIISVFYLVGEYINNCFWNQQRTHLHNSYGEIKKKKNVNLKFSEHANKNLSYKFSVKEIPNFFRRLILYANSVL